mgnify:CR=1 FL=1
MFTLMKPDFCCTSQSISMFVAINTEFSFAMKPNSRFMFLNIDFGFDAGVVGASEWDRVAEGVYLSWMTPHPTVRRSRA